MLSLQKIYYLYSTLNMLEGPVDSFQISRKFKQHIIKF